MISWFAPGPWIVTGVVMEISPLVSAIVPVTSNVTTPPAAMAARKDPGPLSARVVTEAAWLWRAIIVKARASGRYDILIYGQINERAWRFFRKKESWDQNRYLGMREKPI
jgi:hypothetical protein